MLASRFKKLTEPQTSANEVPAVSTKEAEVTSLVESAKQGAYQESDAATDTFFGNENIGQDDDEQDDPFSDPEPKKELLVQNKVNQVANITSNAPVLDTESPAEASSANNEPLYSSEDGKHFISLGNTGLELDGKPSLKPNGWFLRIRDKSRHHFVNGVRHHDTEPALVFAGDKGYMYYQHGKKHHETEFAVNIITGHNDKRTERMIRGRLHAEGVPASILVREDKSVVTGYYQNGLLHREDGPAFIIQAANGEMITEEYYKLGVMHRIDGPAMIRKNRTEYRQEGELHRVDGPALTVMGIDEYYIQGVQTDAKSARKSYANNRNQTVGASQQGVSRKSAGEKEDDAIKNISDWKKSRSDGAKSKTDSPVRSGARRL